MVRSTSASFLLAPLLSACVATYAPTGAANPSFPVPPASETRALPAGSSGRADWPAADARALSAPPGLKRDAPALAAWLTRGARNDTEKARAIFRWLAENVAYDVGGMADPVTIRPDEVLERGQSICDGYAGAFALLGKLSGLEVVTIHGYAKGYDYRPGASFERPNHAWNAVRIDGRWQLIDATWGAGHVAGGRYVKQLDDFFFLPDPAALAFTHLPKDPRWTLLRRPLTRAGFEAQPVVRPAFFRAGFTAGDAAEALRRRSAPVEVFLLADPRVRVRGAPPQRELAAGQAYHFEVEAPVGTSVVLVNADRWATMAGAGLYAGSIRPRRGDLAVAVRTPGDRDYRVMLRYQVM